MAVPDDTTLYGHGGVFDARVYASPDPDCRAIANDLGLQLPLRRDQGADLVGARKKKAKKKDGKKKDVNKTPKKKAKKNNGQARHEVALKPLEAEPLLKALKTEWDKMRKEKKTEVHACEILAKVVACCHVSHPPHQEKGIQNAGQDHRVSSHYST